MRTSLATPLVLLLAACAAARPPPAQDRFTLSVVADPETPRWREFRAGDVGFDVEFPADPSRSRAQDASGAVDLFSARLGAASYLVGALPGALAAPAERERALETYPAEIVARLGGDVVADTRATVDGRPARDLAIAPADGGAVRVRVVATDARVYLVSVATRDPELPPEAERFVASFRAGP